VPIERGLADITRQTGMAIMRAIVEGERDPVILAQFWAPSCKSSQEMIAKALTGTWKDEQIFVLQQALALVVALGSLAIIGPIGTWVIDPKVRAIATLADILPDGALPLFFSAFLRSIQPWMARISAAQSASGTPTTTRNAHAGTSRWCCSPMALSQPSSRLLRHLPTTCYRELRPRRGW
jgi:hypothetical protein